MGVSMLKYLRHENQIATHRHYVACDFGTLCLMELTISRAMPSASVATWATSKTAAFLAIL
jgi:hypothetical protein